MRKLSISFSSKHICRLVLDEDTLISVKTKLLDRGRVQELI